MKKTIAGLFMCAFLFMGQTCSTGTTISYAAVSAAVQAACGIIVPIADVTALVTANPTLVTAAEVANAICAAFKAQQAKLQTQASSTPTALPTSGHLVVDGVLVHYTVK